MARGPWRFRSTSAALALFLLLAGCSRDNPAGRAAPDVGQYFDRAIQAPGAANYPDNASHPLGGLTTADNSLLFAAQGSRSCLGCHYPSGPARTSDECLKCHFENQGSGETPGSLDVARHMNGRVELAAVNGNASATTEFAIGSIPDYDAWCQQCHKPGATTTLGGVAPSGKTVVDDAAFANSRHRAVATVGCIYCHHPHGTTNTRLVRNNPANRWNAGATPLTFGVFPGDNTGSYGGSVYPPNQNIAYRSRVDANFADAGDENNYCNKACHNPSKPKDRIVVRDNTTGNYMLAGTKKLYFVSGALYSIDNMNLYRDMHAHPNGEIIPTDNMVRYYAAESGISGPSFYHYPGGTGSDPATFGLAQNLLSPLPFFPDFPDGDRDFPNGYLDKGPIRYRYTCSTCHNPHGTTLANAPGASGWPDLRLPRTAPHQLCFQCH